VLRVRGGVAQGEGGGTVKECWGMECRNCLAINCRERESSPWFRVKHGALSRHRVFAVKLVRGLDTALQVVFAMDHGQVPTKITKRLQRAARRWLRVMEGIGK
jgi:hypothetical protein